MTLKKICEHKNKNMNLYILETNKMGNFYVIAKTPNDAKEKLEGDLNKANYGLSDSREVRVITLLAKEIGNFPVDIPNFSSKNKLLFLSSMK